MGIRNWFTRRKGAKQAALPAPQEQRELHVIVVHSTSDGWMPVASYAGTDMEQILTGSTWAYACMEANAEAIAQLEPTIQRRGTSSEGKWVDMTDSNPPPALQLAVEQPMGQVPVPWSWRDWIRHVILQLYVYGVAYVDTRGDRLYLLKNPSQVKTVLDEKTGWPSAYTYGQATFRPGELIEIRFPKPGSYSGGTSPMQAAWGMVSVGQSAKSRLEWHLANRAAPGIILKIPGTYLRDSARDEILEYLTDNYVEASKTGTPLVIGEDMSVDSKAMSGYKDQTQEMFDADRMSRESIFAVFRTPPMILGVYDKAPIQQYKTAILGWWQTALFPVLAGILDQLNVQWVWPRFGKQVRLWYSLTGSQIGLELMNERIQVAQGLTKLGYPANAAAAAAGLTMPHYDELDVPNVQWVIAGRTEEAKDSNP